MFSSPLPAVLKAQKDGALGELNLQPYPAQCGNCAAWLTYALLVKNVWIVIPNIVGLSLGLFFTYTGHAMGSVQQKSSIMKSFVSYASAIGLAIIAAFSGVFSIPAKEVIGRVGIALLMIYYCSPLATISTVIKTKNAQSIDPLLTVAGILNGLFWFMYGRAISDIYVWGPNGIGAILATISTACYLVYKK
ncbi:hypothetical protein GUITHDRAFT_106374 [Guillardia theta CCMP2712]|uniref:Uncharacterized protein n=1 Tax=Guillardia theta (strain CCMP2712) TaxID=905079 RepID=L1JH67_GUITC|nr:hypothetical protein GUITHDRAFT_106374 [Guillardia theta CCMP2712]EKX47826.1 hypothetical protein GUITHDRAFT_106374 [Guillardia theta CCMP2712]|eukprot:XP_005834806.1 hypothetical protein GUITHDRAFT_106374 [Guillardia theta CCMP2712]